MHIVKGQKPLGIQITGGRGSKRGHHGIIIAHVEEGGVIDRYMWFTYKLKLMLRFVLRISLLHYLTAKAEIMPVTRYMFFFIVHLVIWTFCENKLQSQRVSFSCELHSTICAHLCFRDGRLHAGDELLMINSQSLVGLTHQEAVDVLRSTAGLVQLVVASKVQPKKHTASAFNVLNSGIK